LFYIPDSVKAKGTDGKLVRRLWFVRTVSAAI